MTWGFVAGAAISVVGGMVISNQQKQAAKGAANAQTVASQAGIAEQQRQFDAIQKLLAPYVNAGTGAVTAQGDLLGLNGPEAQQKALAGIQGSPQFTMLSQQGENAILQNASATGGLRGGNTQGALAQFRPQLLSQLIDQQFGRLGQVAQLGQASAAGQAAAGLQTGQNISGLLGNIGQAQAGGYLANGAANANLANTFFGAASKAYGGVGEARGWF